MTRYTVVLEDRNAPPARVAFAVEAFDAMSAVEAGRRLAALNGATDLLLHEVYPASPPAGEPGRRDRRRRAAEIRWAVNVARYLLEDLDREGKLTDSQRARFDVVRGVLDKGGRT